MKDELGLLVIIFISLVAWSFPHKLKSINQTLEITEIHLNISVTNSVTRTVKLKIFKHTDSAR